MMIYYSYLNVMIYYSYLKVMIYCSGMYTNTIQRVMAMVNHYAYTYVAIYGHPMVQAARHTYR